MVVVEVSSWLVSGWVFDKIGRWCLEWSTRAEVARWLVVGVRVVMAAGVDRQKQRSGDVVGLTSVDQAEYLEVWSVGSEGSLVVEDQS